MRSVVVAAIALHAYAAMGEAVPSAVVAQVNVTPEVRLQTLQRILGTRQAIKESGALADVPIANLFAAELEQDGRVFPIVWSLSDPVFRGAVDQGKVRGPASNPSLEDALSGARALQAAYLIVVSAWREEDTLFATARLYSGRRQVWQDQRSMTALVGGRFDDFTAAQSLSRTWTQVLAAGPLKGLSPQRRHVTPDPEEGAKPPVAETLVTEPKTVDNRELFEEVAKRMASGQGPSAVVLLRDAVDQEPLNAERRMALVDVLMKLGEPEAAAETARRSAELIPERVELWLAAARAWTAAGKLQDALQDLNQAVARDPESPQTRLMLGELQLAQLRFGFALEHLDKSIEKAPTGDSLFKRAVCKFLSGDMQGGAADLEEAGKLASAGDEPLAQYRFASRTASTSAEAVGGATRDIIQLSRLRHDDPAAIAESETAIRRVEGAIALLERVQVPAQHVKSQARLLLALKLLRQSLSEVRSHQTAPDEATLAEATINLGEALKQLREATKEFDAERAKPSGE